MIITIKQEKTKNRLDKFLTKELPISRSQIQKLIKNQKILVNNQPASVHQFLKLNDKIKIYDKEVKQIEKNKLKKLEPNPKIKLKIIYEDDDIIVIDKKSGVLVHPTDQMEPDTIVNGLLSYFPKIKNIGDNPLRPGIVHRLDKDVTGLMLICKNQQAFDHYKKQFQTRKVKKIYTALVHGTMVNDADTIDLPIIRSKNQGKMAVRSKEQGGKKAITKYTVIKKFNHFSLLEVEILTGRTHQIRVHLNYLNHPVVGDKLYKQKNVKQKLELDRPFLHSTILGFKNMKGEYQEYESDLPLKLKKIIKELK